MEDKLEVALIVEKVVEDLDEETKWYYKMLDNATLIEESNTPLDLFNSSPGEEATLPKLELKEFHNSIKYVFLGKEIPVWLLFPSL